ncbi:MAG TPA: hypothetical protein VFH29_08825 [Anaerolineales bacterium]|nr:hypothetical protein [Anaerolineales bacterium]
MSFMVMLARLADPLYVALAALTYMLGAGVSKYLGHPVRGRVLVLGLAVVLLLQLAMGWLNAAFSQPKALLRAGDAAPDQPRTRRAIISGAIAALAAAASLLFALVHLDGAAPAGAVTLGASLVIVVLYAVPPMRAVDRGFGELLLAIQIAYLAPLAAFLLQAQDNHLLLNVCTVALTFLLVALLLVFELASYAEDIGRGRVTLLTRIGWERALAAHDAMLVAGYAVLAISIISAFSFSLIGPALLTLPFAILQVFLLRGLSSGAKPMWNLLRANALAIFVLTAYFLAVSLWLR